MAVIQTNVPISNLKRRIAGERNWRMEIEEVLANQKLLIQILRSIRNRNSSDAITQGLVADALGNVAESAMKLGELYHYKGDDAPASNGNGNGNGGQAQAEGGPS